MQHADTAVTAAFVMEGLQSAGYKNVIKAWDQGVIELVDAVMECVPVLLAMRDYADEAIGDQGYPGVFDYEVSNPMGLWLGEWVIESAALPPRADMIQYAATLTRDFFVRKGDENGEGIAEAITVAAHHLLEPPVPAVHPVAGFTDGPWHVEPTDGNPNSLSIVKYGDGYIAEINRADAGLQAIDHADARLIAAAPALYDAVQSAHAKFELQLDEAALYNELGGALTLADGQKRARMPEG
jgi:hypothetical protein